MRAHFFRLSCCSCIKELDRNVTSLTNADVKDCVSSKVLVWRLRKSLEQSCKQMVWLYAYCQQTKDRQCTCKCRIEALSRNHCFRGKALNITYSDCVSVAFGIQYAVCMLRFKLSLCGLSGIPYSSTLSHQRQNFCEKKDLEHKIFCDFHYNFFFWNISHSKKNWVGYDKKCVLIFI